MTGAIVQVNLGARVRTHRQVGARVAIEVRSERDGKLCGNRRPGSERSVTQSAQDDERRVSRVFRSQIRIAIPVKISDIQGVGEYGHVDRSAERPVAPPKRDGDVCRRVSR